MSIIAIFSDIHGNYEALEVVLNKCRELKVDTYVSLGDIVGYGAEPSRCIAAVRALCPRYCVIGNHDFYSVHNTDTCGFNPKARIAIEWTREQLSQEEKAWLLSFTDEAKMPIPGATFVHATLDTPLSWAYLFDRQHAKVCFEYLKTPLGFCGHSHMPVAFCRRPFVDVREPVVEVLNEWTINPSDGENLMDFSKEKRFTVVYRAGGIFKYMFNIGSVGQPRNHDPRASFAVINTELHTVTRYALPYDIAAAQAKILAAGLPERLADRLEFGI